MSHRIQSLSFISLLLVSFLSCTTCLLPLYPPWLRFWVDFWTVPSYSKVKLSSYQQNYHLWWSKQGLQLDQFYLFFVVGEIYNFKFYFEELSTTFNAQSIYVSQIYFSWFCLLTLFTSVCTSRAFYCQWLIWYSVLLCYGGCWISGWHAGLDLLLVILFCF